MFRLSQGKSGYTEQQAGTIAGKQSRKTAGNDDLIECGHSAKVRVQNRKPGTKEL